MNILKISFFLLVCISLQAQATKQAKQAKQAPVAKEPTVNETVKPTPTMIEPTVKQKVDDDYTWTMYLRVSNYSVKSATAENALKVNNAFLLNRILGNRLSFATPSTGNFTGTGFDYGFGVRHGKLFKSNWLFSGASLTDTGSTALTIDSFSVNSSFLRSSVSSFTQTQYSDNSLKTGKISYMAEFFPLNSMSDALSKFSIKFGPEIYGNGLKMNAPLAFANTTGSATFSPNSSNPTTLNLNSTSLDFIAQRKQTYNEAFFNMVVGLGYAFDINKTRIDFGVDYFKSVASAGSQRESYNNLLNLGTIPLPIQVKNTGTFSTDLSGYRLSAGIKYQIWEHFGIRLFGGMSEATHNVTSSKFKDTAGNTASLLSGNFSSLILNSILSTGLGPNPSSVDKRTQIGIEFVFRF